MEHIICLLESVPHTHTHTETNTQPYSHFINKCSYPHAYPTTNQYKVDDTNAQTPLTECQQRRFELLCALTVAMVDSGVLRTRGSYCPGRQRRPGGRNARLEFG